MESREERLKKLKEKYLKRGIRFYECPVCGEIYKNCCGLVRCGNCRYIDKHYKYTDNGRTIIKKTQCLNN